MFSTIHEAELFFNSRKSIGIKPGLERVQALLDAIGNPEKKIQAIHVAGTNGKGSAIHFLNDGLRANNIVTGIFTSPSFHGLTGYMMLNSEEIEEALFINILNRIYPTIQKMDKLDMAPTEFEIITAIAFLYFSENGDIILIETGMGGRFDTTNVIVPLLSIITNVTIDHTAYLGETTREIAWHKAGIIKKYVPVIIGDMVKDALEVVREEAFEKQAACYILGEDVQVNDKLLAGLTMQGDHQYRNATLALKALEILIEKGYELDSELAIKGLLQTTVPGRYEQLHATPIIIIDAAHNKSGIQSLIDTVNKRKTKKKKHVIAAIFKDKNINEILNLLNRNFDRVTLTTFEHPRAATIQEIEKVQANRKDYQAQEDWKSLVEVVMKQEDQEFFITGSMHFITLVRRYILEQKIKR